ncbi:MAG: serine/threonine-protein kinase [Beutenbergiaceae bacterium]
MTDVALADHLTVRQVIGVGSFSTVYQAHDARLDSDVVIKLLAENHSLNAEIRERFIAEGRSLRRVRSPHVVTVHDIGETARQQPYLVLGLADRGTVAQRVAALRERGWTATAEDVLALARPLALALATVHAADLVHRDLSPSNLLVESVPGLNRPPLDLFESDERLLLSDLGLCKDLALNSGLTVAGGTAGFRPPEQRTAGVVDARADLWSASALLMWLIEGAQLPPRLTTVLRRSLNNDPGRRHGDTKAWLTDIEQALAVPPEQPSAAPAQRGLPVWRTVAAGLLLMMLGVLGGVAWDSVRQPGSSTASASIAITGPDTVAVGQQVTFAVESSGVTGWVWILPTGAYVADTNDVTLTATSAGPAQLELRALDGEGRELLVVHEFQVE